MPRPARGVSLIGDSDAGLNGGAGNHFEVARMSKRRCAPSGTSLERQRIAHSAWNAHQWWRRRGRPKLYPVAGQECISRNPYGRVRPIEWHRLPPVARLCGANYQTKRPLRDESHGGRAARPPSAHTLRENCSTAWANRVVVPLHDASLPF